MVTRSPYAPSDARAWRMRVILFGATGMVGQGVLREALADPHVESVLAVGRAAIGQRHPKLRELVRAEMFDWSDAAELAGYHACFFCLGVSYAGMSEESYRRVTYDLTMAAARKLAELNPDMIFIYVSGAGTDATEQGRSMWARVKGQTENALSKLSFRGVYLFRPGFIMPMHGIKSKTPLYRIGYAVAGPLYPLWNALFPRYVSTTEKVGRAMLRVAQYGFP